LEWERRYNNPINGEDDAYSIDIDNAGNSFVTGRSYNGYNYDILTICYDQSGNQLWQKSFNGSSNVNDEPKKIKIDSQNNIYITGITNINSNQDVVLLKYNQNGNLLWNRKMFSVLNNTAFYGDFDIDRAGNIYTWLGVSELPYGAFLLLKFNPLGDTLWSGKIKDTLFNGISPKKIICDSLGNIFALCSNSKFNYLAKFRTDGVKLWQIRRSNMDLVDFCVNNSGELFATGTKYSSNSDLAILKYDHLGHFVWEIFYDNGLNEHGFKVIPDNFGNCFITGSAYYFNNTIVLKYNVQGTLQWLRTINGLNYDNINFSIKNDFLYLSGCKYVNQSFKKINLTKYNLSGAELFTTDFNTLLSNEDIPSDMKVTDNGLIFLTGKSYASGSHYDYITLKISQLIGINPISSEIPIQFSLSQNYPNPFNPSTKIKFSIPSIAQTFLYVYDILGGEIATLVNQQLQPGTYEVEWEASQYPSGVYFYTLRTTGFKETKRMVLLK
jgi:hypothetical protein